MACRICVLFKNKAEAMKQKAIPVFIAYYCVYLHIKKE